MSAYWFRERGVICLDFAQAVTIAHNRARVTGSRHRVRKLGHAWRVTSW